MMSIPQSLRRNQRGFTLMELLLSIGLLAMLIAGIYQFFDSWMQRATNRTAATEMMRVQNAAQDYAYANFDTLLAQPGAVFHEIPIATLTAGNYLPTGFQARNVFRQNIRVFHRNLTVNRLRPDGTVATDASGNALNYTAIQILTVSDNPAGSVIRVANKRLMDIARAGGPKMGFYSAIVQPGISYANRIAGVFNEWSIENVGDLVALGYSGVPDANGGYLAAFGLVSNEDTDVNDNLLYRLSIPGRPELNRMQANLIMNGNPIENAGTIVADKIWATGNVAFRGLAQGAAAETAQALTVDQALRINGNGISRFNMKTSSPGCSFVDVGGGNRTIAGGGCAVSGGEVQIIAPTDNSILDAGAVNASGNFLSDIANAATINANGVSTFDTISGTAMDMTNTVVVPTTNISAAGGSVTTSQLQTANMDVTGGTNVGGLAAASLQPGGATVTTNGTIKVGNAVELTGDISATNVNVTDTLYSASATSGYNDVSLARPMVCTTTGGRVYCEPNGDAIWNINGHQYREHCQNDTGDGYQCWHYRDGAYYGYCRFTRATGVSGQAYHTSNCS